MLSTRTMSFADGVMRTPGVLLQALPLLSIIAILAYVAIALRFFLFETAPFFADHAQITTDLLNLIIYTFTNAFKLIYPIVVDVIDIVTSVVDFLKSFGRDWHRPSLVMPDMRGWADDPRVLKPEQVRNWLHRVPIECKPYNNMITIVHRFLKHFLTDYVCPVIRVTYPVEWLSNLSITALGWLSFDATPLGVRTPNGHANNCDRPDDDIDWLCVGLGSGYIIAEFILPLFLLTLFGGLLLVPAIKDAISLTIRFARQLATVIRKVSGF